MVYNVGTEIEERLIVRIDASNNRPTPSTNRLIGESHAEVPRRNRSRHIPRRPAAAGGARPRRHVWRKSTHRTHRRRTARKRGTAVDQAQEPPCRHRRHIDTPGALAHPSRTTTPATQ